MRLKYSSSTIACGALADPSYDPGEDACPPTFRVRRLATMGNPCGDPLRPEDFSRVQLVSHIPRPERDNSVPHVSLWRRIEGGLMRIIYVPASTDEGTIQALLWYEPDKAN